MLAFLCVCVVFQRHILFYVYVPYVAGTHRGQKRGIGSCEQLNVVAEKHICALWEVLDHLCSPMFVNLGSHFISDITLLILYLFLNQKSVLIFVLCQI